MIGQHYLYEIPIDHFRAWVFEGLGVTCVFYTLQKMRL